MAWLDRLRKRWSRDDGTTEIIAYVFMFAIGSMALVFAMDVLTDAQRRGQEVATAQQADQLGQLSAGLIEQAARAAQRAPNATYNATFELPNTVGPHNLTVEVTTTDTEPSVPCDEDATLHVHSNEESISTSFSLGNVSTVQIEGQCLSFEGEVDTSAQAANVRYVPPPDPSSVPKIVLEPTSKVR